MYELVLWVCLMAAPDICNEKRLPFQAPTSLMDCMWQGQTQMVRWLDENPQWHLKRWRCAPPEA